jgi:HK97 family phage portal protein
MANWLERIFGAKIKAAEGEYRPGPYSLSGGWLSAAAGKFMNFWQMGHNVQPYGESSAMVEACISAYSQTVAMCPGDHWRTNPNGGRDRVTDSALSRVLRQPNDYQSISDLLLNLTRRLYEKGEAFAYAPRNGRTEIAELHLMLSGQPMIGADGSIYYHLGGNEIAERRFDFSIPVPARDVLHVRLHTPRHPLKGVSPILATCLERAMAGAALNQQVVFYLNQARPSFMLETDEKLTAQQTKDLREAWNEQTQGENAGGTPILAWGLKAKPVSITPADARLADMLKITNESIALAFRMPLAVLGLGDTPFASTEALMSSWKASGLGFALNHIEEALGNLFRLKGQPDEYVEFDTEAMMRSAFKDRIEGLARGVLSGIYAPDEARNKEGLPTVPGGFGAEPRVQQQVIPLSAWEKGLADKKAPAAASPPANDGGDTPEPPERDAPDGRITDLDRARFRASFRPSLRA